MKIKIAVTRGAKRAGRDHVVALVEIACVSLDQVVQEDVVDAVPFARHPDQARYLSWHRDHAQVSCRWFGVAAQLESHAQGFINDVGKGMRRIDGDRSQNRINPSSEKKIHRIFARTLQLSHRQNTNAFAGECRQKLLVPALILIGNE